MTVEASRGKQISSILFSLCDFSKGEWPYPWIMSRRCFVSRVLRNNTDVCKGIEETSHGSQHKTEGEENEGNKEVWDEEEI